LIFLGDLAKLVMAKEGLRHMEHIDERLAHEFADCLWSILVLSKKYDVNLESAFLQTIAELEERIKEDLGKT